MDKQIVTRNGISINFIEAKAKAKSLTSEPLHYLAMEEWPEGQLSAWIGQTHEELVSSLLDAQFQRITKQSMKEDGTFDASLWASKMAALLDCTRQTRSDTKKSVALKAVYDASVKAFKVAKQAGDAELMASLKAKVKVDFAAYQAALIEESGLDMDLE